MRPNFWLLLTAVEMFPCYGTQPGVSVSAYAYLCETELFFGFLFPWNHHIIDREGISCRRSRGLRFHLRKETRVQVNYIYRNPVTTVQAKTKNRQVVFYLRSNQMFIFKSAK